MKFVDEARIHVRSGRGGDGSVSFLREKFRPKGGPDGGAGGRGGSVVFVADAQLGTLLDFRFQQHHSAPNGQPGQGRMKTGPSGEDLIIRVPVGTMVTDEATGERLADLAKDGVRAVICRGGRGGRGNMTFATSTNQSPRYAEKGQPAEERHLRLTLKLLADVGLVGFPNAGKSTLISRLSHARPKVADYPFTTLVPNLGIVRTALSRSFVLADIPGLIEGASDGAGLGTRFLKHVERVAALAVLLDVGFDPKRHPVTDYEILIGELGKYSERMLKKPRILVLTKADLPDTAAAVEDVQAIADREGIPLFVISAVTGQGLDALAYALQALVDSEKAKPKETFAPALWPKRAVVAFEDEPEEDWQGEIYYVDGDRAEREDDASEEDEDEDEDELESYEEGDEAEVATLESFDDEDEDDDEEALSPFDDAEFADEPTDVEDTPEAAALAAAARAVAEVKKPVPADDDDDDEDDALSPFKYV